MIYCLKNDIRTQARKSTIENDLELIDSLYWKFQSFRIAYAFNRNNRIIYGIIIIVNVVQLSQQLGKMISCL